MSALLLVHAAATWFLTGLIWTIQVVHYPLFAGVGRGRFEAYHREHARRIGWIVAVAMPIEAVAAAVLAWRPPAGIRPATAWLGLVLVVVVWASTALVQIPAHRRLADGFDARAHAGLVRWNWIRTLAWTVRSALAAAFLAWCA